jgi:hypothetical protein
LARYWKTSKRRGKSWDGIKRKDFGKKEEHGDFLSIELYEMGTMLGGKEAIHI